MQLYEKGRVVPHTTQNHGIYNARGYLQNQQGAMYMTYAPYLSNPPYLQQEPIGYMTYAPYPQYSQQEIGYMTYAPYPLYSQQEIRARLLQDPIANDMFLYDQQDQNCLFQNHYRRQTMPEYRNGEMVMVRCNQYKWMNGVIQKMSKQGMQIWIIDANVLVNVPLVLLPTCVLKMTTYSTLESLPQVQPIWTITNNGGYQKVLIQCVCRTHLSHCPLFYVLDNNVCAICKLSISNIIDMVSPWNCCHQVHNHCLQLQMQQCSTIICPSCNENSPYQFNMSKYSNFAHSRPSNGQQQRFDLQCPCGFKSVMIGNINATIFCPNCHQPLNVNSMTTDMQSGQALNNMNINPMMVRMQNRDLLTSMNLNPRTKRIHSEEPPINMDLLYPSSKLEKEILESSKSSEIPKRDRFFNAQDFRFRWPMQSFSGHNRLEAIEEGLEVNTSSLESTTIEKRYGSMDAIPFLPTNLIQKELSSSQSSLRNDFNDALYPTPITYFQNELWKDNALGTKQLATSLLKDELIPHTELVEVEEASKSTKHPKMDKRTNTTIEGHKLWKKESEPNTIIGATQDQTLGKKASQTIESIVEIESSKIWKKASEFITNYDARKGHELRKRVSETVINFGPIEGQKLGKKASESNTTVANIDVLKLWKKTSEPNTTITTIKDHRLEKIEKGDSSNDFVASSSSVAPVYVDHSDETKKVQKLWRRASVIDWSKKLVNDDEIKVSKETNSSMDPNSAPMYVNHFADFVKLAMGASSSIAKDIIASASASTSSSILNSPLQLESITPTRISPPPTFVMKASSLFKEAPTWIIHSKNSDEATSTSPTWISVIKDGVDSRKDDKRWE